MYNEKVNCEYNKSRSENKRFSMSKMSEKDMTTFLHSMRVANMPTAYLAEGCLQLASFMKLSVNIESDGAMLLCLIQEVFSMFKLAHGVMNKMANTPLCRVVSSVS